VPIRVEWLDVIMDYNPCAGYEDVARLRHGLWRNDYRNRVIADKARTFAPEDQVLIMVAHLEHAFYLKAHLPEYTLCYAESKGDDKLFERAKRNKLIPADEPRMTDSLRMSRRLQFEERKLQKVIATDIWSTGVNFNGLQVLIRADARSSAIKDTQIPGRVSRTHNASGKQMGILVDCLDQFDDGFRAGGRKRRRDYQQKGWTQVMPTGGPRLLQQ
jgi:superfamily II DNA or RNA helicase